MFKTRAVGDNTSTSCFLKKKQTKNLPNCRDSCGGLKVCFARNPKTAARAVNNPASNPAVGAEGRQRWWWWWCRVHGLTAQLKMRRARLCSECHPVPTHPAIVCESRRPRVYIEATSLPGNESETRAARMRSAA